MKAEGERAAEGGVQPTRVEAVGVHEEALQAWIKAQVQDLKRPIVLWRKKAVAQRLSDGGWRAASRLLVVEGYRDVTG